MSSEFSKELIEEKRRQRLALRNEYLKKMYNPHAEGGGHLFDAAIQRFQSMKVSKIEHFRETPLTIRNGILFMIPLGVIMYFMKKTKDEKEAEYRAGKVAYKDRLFKFI